MSGEPFKNDPYGQEGELTKSGTLRGRIGGLLTRSFRSLSSSNLSRLASGQNISEPVSHAVDDVLPPMPEYAHVVEERFAVVAKEMGMPPQANMSLETKWKIVWNYERSHSQLEQPEEYARALEKIARKEGDLDLQEVATAGVAGLSTRPPGWLQRFAELDGARLVLLILQKLLADRVWVSPRVHFALYRFHSICGEIFREPRFSLQIALAR